MVEERGVTQEKDRSKLKGVCSLLSLSLSLGFSSGKQSEEERGGLKEGLDLLSSIDLGIFLCRSPWRYMPAELFMSVLGCMDGEKKIEGQEEKKERRRVKEH